MFDVVLNTALKNNALNRNTSNNKLAKDGKPTQNLQYKNNNGQQLPNRE